jgi:hypothetical protein
MRKLAMMLVALLFIMSACKKDINNSQSFVFQAPEKKVVLVEEFTGVRCQYCPDGARVLSEMTSANPGKVIAIGIHGVSFNTPHTGDVDLTSSWADALVGFAQNTVWPGAMVNRRPFNRASELTIDRYSWSSAASIIMAEDAPVNIGIKSVFDDSVARITVEVYYTADGGGANLINIAIVESGIITQQAGAQDLYIHKNVLRDLLTGQWGAPIAATKANSSEIFEYTYVLKAGEIAANCSIIAFVTLGDRTEVLNVDEAQLVNGEKF